MTVPAASRRSPVYTGNGVTTAFPFSFKVFAGSDLQVVATSVAGVLSTLVLNSDYTVTLNADQTVSPGGSVNVLVAPASGVKLVIIGALPNNQPLGLPGGGNFNPVAIENELDRQVMQIQQIADGLAGAITVPIGETVPALPAAAVRANYVLGFDALGNPVAITPVSGSVGTLATDLANSVTPSKGAGQVGFQSGLGYGAGTVGKALNDVATPADAGNYFNAATLDALLQELGNPRSQFQVGGVNVLRYIPPALWPAIVNYTSVVDLSTYLQSALSAEPNLIFPDGLYNTASTLVARDAATIQGINRRGAILKGTTPITILKAAIDGFDTTFRRIFFKGTGCTAISSSAGGSFPNYLIRAHIDECDFAWNLTYGINSSIIFLTCDKSTFGYYGDGGAPAAGAGTMTAIRSYTTGSLDPNLNRLSNCIFRAGGAVLPALDLSGGAGWVFQDCDFEQGGQVLLTANIQALKFLGSCWFEGNVATNQLFQIGACTTPALFDGAIFRVNLTPVLWKYATGSTKGLVIRYCDIGLNATGFPLLDSTTLQQTLPGNGSVTWHDNNVSGGAAGNKVISSTDFRGGMSPRASGTAVTTTGPSATITTCTDAGASIVRNGVGDSTITLSNPVASAANRIRAIFSPYSGSATQYRVFPNSPTSIQVQFFTAAGASIDTAFGFAFSGD